MVDFVLEDHGCEAFDGVFDYVKAVFAVDGCIFDHDFLRSEDFAAAVRDGQAAFGADGEGVRSVDYADVRVYFERFVRLVESLYGDDSAVETDLRAGYADAVLGGMGDCSDHQAGEEGVVLGTERGLGEVSALRTEHLQVEAVGDGQHAHDAVGCVQQGEFVKCEIAFGALSGAGKQPKSAKRGYE